MWDLLFIFAAFIGSIVAAGVLSTKRSAKIEEKKKENIVICRKNCAIGTFMDAAILFFFIFSLLAATGVEDVTLEYRLKIVLYITGPWIIIRYLLSYGYYKYQNGIVYAGRLIGPCKHAKAENLYYKKERLRKIIVYEKREDGKNHYFGRIDGALLEDYEDLLNAITASKPDYKAELKDVITDEFKLYICMSKMIGMILSVLFGVLVIVLGTGSILDEYLDGSFELIEYVLWQTCITAVGLFCIYMGARKIYFRIHVKNNTVIVHRLFRRTLILPVGMITKVEWLSTPAHWYSTGKSMGWLPETDTLRLCYGDSKKLLIEEDFYCHVKMLREYLRERQQSA